MKSTYTILAFAALSACSPSFKPEHRQGNTVVLTDDNAHGGDIAKHYHMLQDMWETGTSVRIEADTVSSAATFFLAADGACMANRDTVFRFHGPQHTATAALVASVTVVPPPISFMSKERAAYIRGEMAELYEYAAPGLGDWFLENAAHKAGISYATLTATDLNARFGFPFCDEVQ